MTEALGDLSCDAFLGGRVHLWQPRKGYRAGLDPVLLAAAVPAKPGQSVLDLGCGAGAAALCLGARVPGLTLTGVEVQQDYASLARRNGLDVVQADLTHLPPDLRQVRYDHVIANPPYFDPARRTPAKNAGREVARAEDTRLSDWITVAARRLAPRGYLHVVQHVSRLPDLLAACQERLGSVEVLPLCARMGRAPHLVILRARKEGRAEFVLHASLALHAGDRHVSDRDDYAPEISAILRDAAPLKWPGTSR